MAARALILLTLLAAALGIGAISTALTAGASTITPVEDCFTSGVSVFPIDPEPGDVVKFRVVNCSAPGELYIAIYYYYESGGYDFLGAFTTTDYIYQFYLTMPSEPGCLEIWLNDQVYKRISVGGAACYGQPNGGGQSGDQSQPESGGDDNADEEESYSLLLVGAGLAVLIIVAAFLRKG